MVLMLTLLPSAALYQKRVALVVGIDGYDDLDQRAQLKKARAGAAAIANAFAALGSAKRE